jgi:hypothetical protein
MSANPTVAEAFVGLLDKQTTFERERKASLEARALAVITTSGTLVTLITALTAVATKHRAYTTLTGTRVLLFAALAAFLIAAALAIYGNAPFRVKEIEAASLSGFMAADVWGQPGVEAEREIAAARHGVLVSLQTVNAVKARFLFWAAACEVLAIALTAASASVILLRGWS